MGSTSASVHERLKPLADIMLNSDQGLGELYELKAELGEHLAQAGCITAVDPA